MSFSIPFLARRAARKQLRTQAQEMWLRLQFNRDYYGRHLIADLERVISELRAAARTARSAADVQTAIAAAQPVMDASLEAIPEKTDAPFIAPRTMREIVDTLFVAFGVAIAFRAYFFEPFKIPTGSMQPTLRGIHSAKADGPGFMDSAMPLRAVQWLVTGRRYLDVVAPASGTVTVATDHLRAPGWVLLSVAGKSYRVPTDVWERGEIALGPNLVLMPDNPRTAISEMARGSVKKGESLWRGYVISGDQVFVNRIAWNFLPPKRDSIFVFSTSKPTLTFDRSTAATAAAPDAPSPAHVSRVPFLGLELFVVQTPIRGLTAGQHYIKRLVGLPRETISIDEPRLLVDGEPPRGKTRGIDRVVAKETTYDGYVYPGYRLVGAKGVPNYPNAFLSTTSTSLELGPREYLPMGDNQTNSYDGRYWGPVDRDLLVGPSALVYWPISRRWLFGAR